MVSLISKNTSAEGVHLWGVVRRRPIGDSVRAVNAVKRVRVPKVPERISTRELSGIYLDLLMKSGADLIIGSADLSNNTNVKTSSAKEITPDNFKNGQFSIVQLKTGNRCTMNISELSIDSRVVWEILENMDEER